MEVKEQEKMEAFPFGRTFSQRWILKLVSFDSINNTFRVAHFCWPRSSKFYILGFKTLIILFWKNCLEKHFLSALEQCLFSVRVATRVWVHANKYIKFPMLVHSSRQDLCCTYSSKQDRRQIRPFAQVRSSCPRRRDLTARLFPKKQWLGQTWEMRAEGRRGTREARAFLVN